MPRSQGAKGGQFWHLFLKSKKDLIPISRHNISYFSRKDIHEYKVPSKYMRNFF
jgi:hypothetical protein